MNGAEKDAEIINEYGSYEKYLEHIAEYHRKEKENDRIIKQAETPKTKPNKMKKTIKQTIEVEVEIQLPYYFKNICHAYAILDEQSAVMVNYASTDGESINNYSFMIENILSRSNNEDSIEITSSEFKDLYHETIAKINSKFN